MKAGRELDALIAEKVMGWKLANATDGAEYWDNGKFCGGLWLNEWKPSTNIADAWLAVETIDCVQITKYGNQYDCKIEGLPTVTAETAPLAICLAALKAVGYEMED